MAADAGYERSKARGAERIAMREIYRKAEPPIRGPTGANLEVTPPFLFVGLGSYNWHTTVCRAYGAVAGLPADAPLFARSASGASLTKTEMVDFFAQAAALLGLEGKVSGHSGRIGGATDHFAEETPPICRLADVGS